MSGARELPEYLYRTVSTLAQVTKRPLAEILQDSLAHILPPLDDVPAKEAEVLAHMSTLDDAALWQASRVTMPESQQPVSLAENRGFRPRALRDLERIIAEQREL